MRLPGARMRDAERRRALPSYAVITACRNSARTVARSVASVLNQTVAPREYIFVDGGSTDGTASILGGIMAAAATDPRGIRFELRDQGAIRGITKAWNLGLRECTADIIFILNSDDWYEPQCAETVLERFAADEKLDVVAASERTYARGSDVANGISRTRPLWLFPVAMPLVHPACFVRRRTYERFGLFDDEFEIVADYEFMFRCWRGGARFCNLSEIIVNFELGGTANSNRAIARKEMYAAAARYVSPPALPWLAMLLRALTGALVSD